MENNIGICDPSLHPSCAENKEKFGKNYYCHFSSPASNKCLETQTISIAERGGATFGFFVVPVQGNSDDKRRDITHIVERYLYLKKIFPQLRLTYSPVAWLIRDEAVTKCHDLKECS